nr:hypothetical protein [Tanacetum cinerariifolium]
MMVKRIGELEHIMADLIQVNKDMEERLDSHGSCLHTLEQLDIPQRVSIAVSELVTDAIDWAMQAPLRNCFRDLPEADMKEILHQRMWEFDSYKSDEDHMQLFEALEKSLNRDHSEELTQELAEARKKKKKSRELPKMPPGSPSHQPPPPPPPAGPSGASGAPRASGSAQMPPSPPPPSSTNQESPSKGSVAPSSSKIAASAEYQAWTTTDIRLRPQVTIQSDFFFNKDLEYLRYGSKGRRPELSISKIKAAYYPDAGLEQMVPDQFWIEEECKYDIAAMYGISYWWFQRQRFYIDRNTSEGDRSAVRRHMRILSVQIDEALDYRVKEFRINRMNPGLNKRFWTRKDVDQCNAFIFAIQRRLKTRRIFRNLESFVGGRVREGDYRLLRYTD